MFSKLVNEATLEFSLETDGPLLIKAGESNKIDPSLPDMRFVRCQRNGKETVYLPGSSLKGVFRTRYEQLLMMLKAQPLKTTNNQGRKGKNSGKPKKQSGLVVYQAQGVADRLFGSTEIGSRIRFADAYPSDTVSLGVRTGVGIDRVTGAARQTALFDFEVVEQGVFAAQIRLSNFARYQLALILWILKDIDDGWVTFGMGGSRGNGRMKVVADPPIQLCYRYYGTVAQDMKLRGYFDNDTGKPLDSSNSTKTLLATEYKIRGLDTIIDTIGLSDQKALSDAIAGENKNLAALNHTGK
jgi:CRISPR-associated RAMP protein (TIGR02581 family)